MRSMTFFGSVEQVLAGFAHASYSDAGMILRAVLGEDRAALHAILRDAVWHAAISRQSRESRESRDWREIADEFIRAEPRLGAALAALQTPRRLQTFDDAIGLVADCDVLVGILDEIDYDRATPLRERLYSHWGITTGYGRVAVAINSTKNVSVAVATITLAAWASDWDATSAPERAHAFEDAGCVSTIADLDYEISERELSELRGSRRAKARRRLARASA